MNGDLAEDTMKKCFFAKIYHEKGLTKAIFEGIFHNVICCTGISLVANPKRTR